MNQIEAPEFEALIREERVHWIDVRAPIEFGSGAMPEAINLPLLTNEERHTIGLLYRNEGKEAAIEMGHKLVSGEIRKARIKSWTQEVRANPRTVIYCFRGGMRSQIVQAWLKKESGIDVPILSGGYKALRRFLIEQTEILANSMNFTLISGPTGSGKTQYLKTSGVAYLDLEALARHRGSAFGAYEEALQPCQADFENALAVNLIRLSKVPGPILLEAESRMIGARALPEVLFHKMCVSQRVPLEVPIDERVENIFKDYILDGSLGRLGSQKPFETFRNAVLAISQKLGVLRAQEITEDLNRSQKDFLDGMGLGSNRIWIRKLLVYYYDPLYAKAAIKNRAKINDLLKEES